ncbi:MAG: hypothetical protein IT178_18035 [Acidobacteria bacterium]|nr:hypothetical protein [Acidobacteriota bacterium]
MPPGATANLGYPVGTSVALTDSIPLAAMLLKPFSAVLPDVFQYFGLWLLACFVLQGIFGVALIATVTTNRWLQVLGGGVFALSPLLVHRMGHAALTAHWILLAGLWLGRLDVTPREVAAYYALLFAAMTTIVRQLKPRIAIAVLTSVVALQVIDLWPVYQAKRDGFAMSYREMLPDPSWMRVIPHYRHVVLIPSNMCAPMTESVDFRFVAVPAGVAGATLNGGFAARYDAAAVARYCDTYTRDVANATLRDDSIYVLTPAAAMSFVPALGDRGHCIEVDAHVVCRARNHEGTK